MGIIILLFFGIFEVLYRIENFDFFFKEYYSSLYNIKLNLQYSVNGLNVIYYVKLELNKRFYVNFYFFVIVYMYMILYVILLGEVKIYVFDIVQI